MEAKAQARHVHVTPQKARRVVDLIRGRRAGDALAVLQFAPQAASEPVLKVVQSAIANAREKAERASVAFDERELVVHTAFVDEGATAKRFRPRAQGRAFRINKRTSHITVVVAGPEDGVKPTRKPVTGSAKRSATRGGRRSGRGATAGRSGTNTATRATASAAKGRNS